MPMKTKHNYLTQKTIRRNDSGKIQSIKPIYSETKDPYARVHAQAIDLEIIANKFPESKMQVEINAIPESTYKLLKEDFDYRNGFQEGAGKFYYSPTVNSAIIVHKEL